MITADTIFKELKNKSNKDEALKSARFFKTGKGEYGEGDKFLGMQLKDVQNIVKENWNKITLQQLEKLLHNGWHEARTTALSMLVKKYEKAKDLSEKKAIVDLYLGNVKYINNWDLVDISCHKIIGPYVYETGKVEILYKLADSGYLWSERISVVSCLYFIKKGDFKDILKLSEKFLNHKHDLMHKAVGWMLRETGKKEEKVLLKFLDENSMKMPRTALRYSIEKLDNDARKYYMNKGK
ncbi:MAG: DNA alkylation repair protein [Rickettsiales bacterium]|jgi:3-methyladenine DNA glycosylase AlkD|nr:DNA alkylation repair protein [Rickettsiales bacterium]